MIGDFVVDIGFVEVGAFEALELPGSLGPALLQALAGVAVLRRDVQLLDERRSLLVRAGITSLLRAFDFASLPASMSTVLAATTIPAICASFGALACAKVTAVTSTSAKAEKPPEISFMIWPPLST
jgi:hypothetical protein